MAVPTIKIIFFTVYLVLTNKITHTIVTNAAKSPLILSEDSVGPPHIQYNLIASSSKNWSSSYFI
jgi:hypothetical protein